MISTVVVKLNAAHPDVPLVPLVSFRGSASSVRVVDVPRQIGAWAITGVTVKATYPDGTSVARAAVRVGGAWVATLEACDSVGMVKGGFVVGASGVDENGAAVENYTLGVGDVEILSADSSIHPGLAGHAVTIYDAAPEYPKTGDAYWDGDVLHVFVDGAWRAVGGGGGSVVESETNTGYAANADNATNAGHAGSADHAVNADSAGHAEHANSADFATSAGEASFVDWAGVREHPEFAEKADLAVVMDLVGSGTSANPYAVQLGGVAQTFAQVKSLAETRNAVIRHGRGTYRVTYVGAAEMMWDCTGTVQGAVKTGTIHMFSAGDVVQLVGARELATASMAAYPIVAISGAQALDRTINVYPAVTVAPAALLVMFPARTGALARDFVVRVPSSTVPHSITFPADVDYETDQDDCWTYDVCKANEWYFSESEPGLFKVFHKSFVRTAQV